ncbi:AraC family transcriptional regulator [Paenibacillus sp. UNC451MF]|uniref:AraC family transcriptional regulator n=1 Tax=Paenibacillus sp. UNC451MF TaxID=1449063 RepID=UPI000490102F|nr:AraC family transcriptional regulator [Paenibacillus sp. UNC451MF]
MKIGNNHYINRMLLSYLPILFVTASMLIIIFIAIINQNNVRNAIQANQVTAAFIENTVDSSLKNISVDAQKMVETNDELQQFLDGPLDWGMAFDISNLLSNLKVRYGLIDSIYVYRAKDGMVLDQTTMRPIDQFPDQSYIRSSKELLLTGVWTSPRLKESEGIKSPPSVSVISLGLKIPRDSGSLGYLIINIRVSSIESYIKQMIDQKLTVAELFDAQGKPFFDEKSPAASQNNLIANVVSDYTGWTYRIGIKGGKLLDFLFHGSTVWILLALGAIVFAVGATFYVTRRSYKPIEAILQRINHFSSAIKAPDQKENKNEFAFIDNAIERLITNNMAFQEKQQEHSVIRRQQFLQMLLKEEYEGDPVSWEQERHHFGLEAGYFIVAVLELDHYVKFGLNYNPSDQSLFKFIISSVAVEVAEQNGQRIVVEWISKNLLVFLLISEENGSLEHRVLQISEQIRSWVEEHLEFTVTIGVGTAADEESAIGGSFKAAAEAVSHKVTRGTNQVIAGVEITRKHDGELFDYLDTIRTIVRMLRMSEPNWMNELKRLFGMMTLHHLGKDDVDRLLHYFIFHLEYELEGAQLEVEDWLRKAKPGLLLAIEQSDTLMQLEACFQTALEQLAGQLGELAQSRRYNTLMRQIRDYVAEHFMDPNLSLTMLSDLFQINSKYLSQLFKESFGQNFTDFLLELRIEYAKKLLCESEAPVQEISEKVGYLTPTSFIKVFKKIVGLSPGQYRESQTKTFSEEE